MIISCREAQISSNVYKLDKRQCFLRITERTNCLINVRSLPWSAISIKKFFKNTLITDAAEQHLHSPIYRQTKGFLISHWKQSRLTVFLRPKWSRLVQFNSQAKLDLIWFSFKSRLDQKIATCSDQSIQCLCVDSAPSSLYFYFSSVNVSFVDFSFLFLTPTVF